MPEINKVSYEELENIVKIAQDERNYYKSELELVKSKINVKNKEIRLLKKIIDEKDLKINELLYKNK